MPKRADYLSWEDYFMFAARLTGERSKDEVTQVGCAIVDTHNHVVGMGYNGLPLGLSDDGGYWKKGSVNHFENKGAFVCHAETNAILNCTGNVRGCTMYTTLFPCHECARFIVQSGIVKVVWKDIKRNESSSVSVHILKSANVSMVKHVGTMSIKL